MRERKIPQTSVPVETMFKDDKDYVVVPMVRARLLQGVQLLTYNNCYSNS